MFEKDNYFCPEKSGKLIKCVKGKNHRMSKKKIKYWED
jgi:hypothetical protein